MLLPCVGLASGESILGEVLLVAEVAFFRADPPRSREGERTLKRRAFSKVTFTALPRTPTPITGPLAGPPTSLQCSGRKNIGEREMAKARWGVQGPPAALPVQKPVSSVWTGAGVRVRLGDTQMRHRCCAKSCLGHGKLEGGCTDGLYRCYFIFQTWVFFSPSLRGWWFICSRCVASRRRYAGQQARPRI